jgi:uncharacterized protein with PQ loop repeat
MHHGTHHLHMRKRVHQKFPPYPSPDKLKRFIDKLVYIFGFLTVIFTIPQVYKIWAYQNASGVSVIAWISYLLYAIIFTIYGILHKAKPIAFTYSFLTVLDILVVIGTLLYG